MWDIIARKNTSSQKIEMLSICHRINNTKNTTMTRFYNCFSAFFSYWYPKQMRMVRTYESSYGNGIIQVVVHKNNTQTKP
jgi:hypothetical protein